MRTFGRALALLGLVSSALHPGDAEACTPYQCMDEWGPTAPRAGAQIPSNAPALVLRTWLYSESTPIDEPLMYHPDAGFSLLGSDGAMVASTVEQEPGAWLLRPAVALQDGANYQLGYEAFCNRLYPGSPDPCRTWVPFSAGPAIPPPVDLPSVALDELGATLLPGGASSCGEPRGQIAWARLSIAAGPDMAPWLPLMEWETLVDGVLWARAPYGRIETLQHAPGGTRCGRTITMVYAQCDPSSLGGLSPGLRQVTVTGRLAGTTTGYQSPPLAVLLDCGLDAGTIVSSPATGCGACPHGYTGVEGCCITLGNQCQFTDQCCNRNRCVPDSSGVLRCTAAVLPDAGGEEADAGAPICGDDGGSSAADAGLTLDGGGGRGDAGSGSGGQQPAPDSCGGCAAGGPQSLVPLVLVGLLAIVRRVVAGRRRR